MDKFDPTIAKLILRDETPQIISNDAFGKACINYIADDWKRLANFGNLCFRYYKGKRFIKIVDILVYCSFGAPEDYLHINELGLSRIIYSSIPGCEFNYQTVLRQRIFDSEEDYQNQVMMDLLRYA